MATGSAAGRRRLRPDVPRDGPGAAGQDPALGVRLLRQRRAPAARPGPQPVVARPHRRCVLGRFGRPGRRRGRPDRARQRRRRLDPDPGLGQRPGRAQADPRPPRAGRAEPADAGPDRLRRRPHPQRPGHRGLLPRGRARLPQPATAPAGRRHRPGPHPAARRGDHRGHRAQRVTGGRRADHEDRRAARGPRSRGPHDREPAPRRAEGRLPALLVDARAGDGPRRSPHLRPDLGRRAARQPHPGPGRATPPAGSTGCRARSPGCAG